MESHIGDLSYSIGGNFSYSRHLDWEQYKPIFGNSWDQYRNSKYHRMNSISWGYEVIGQFQSWEEIASYPIDNDQQGNKTLRPGDIKYKDVNGDKVINEMDQRPIGYTEGRLPPSTSDLILLSNGRDLIWLWISPEQVVPHGHKTENYASHSLMAETPQNLCLKTNGI